MSRDTLSPLNTDLQIVSVFALGVSRSACAMKPVVLPVSSAITSPSLTSAATRPAIATFARWFTAMRARNGASPRRVRPTTAPCTFSTSPRSTSGLTMRRTVCSLTLSSMASSRTLTDPRSATACMTSSS